MRNKTGTHKVQNKKLRNKKMDHIYQYRLLRVYNIPELFDEVPLSPLKSVLESEIRTEFKEKLSSFEMYLHGLGIKYKIISQNFAEFEQNFSDQKKMYPKCEEVADFEKIFEFQYLAIYVELRYVEILSETELEKVGIYNGRTYEYKMFTKEMNYKSKKLSSRRPADYKIKTKRNLIKMAIVYLVIIGMVFFLKIRGVI